MKMPTHCPCCHNPLLNEFTPTSIDGEFLRKTCFTKVGHRFSCVTCRDDNMADHAAIELFSKGLVKVNVIWDFQKQNVLVATSYLTNIESIQTLPFFEPDFTDYQKLIDKLRTYLTFS